MSVQLALSKVIVLLHCLPSPDTSKNSSPSLKLKQGYAEDTLSSSSSNTDRDAEMEKVTSVTSVASVKNSQLV